ncbi:hypothetical protein [Streptomyces sp. R44]|uniref:Uncharacterized protein n=1 Tax=Streptomyces sp. R44 TaxID=3238633 RepID=A0AB39SRJ6_9ACTN
MESEVKRRPRAATWWSRLVLAAVLLVGIVLMHVLGHPGERADAAHESGGHVSAASEEHTGAHAGHAKQPAPAHGAAGAAAVCLAVLGAGIGLLLSVRGVLVRRRGAGAPPPARIAHALWAIPPPTPPGSLLTRLSLLRI